MPIPNDVQEFLDDYPDVDEDPDASANLEFYSNQMKCRPDGRTIEQIHERWFGAYDKLEYKHGYIQWLFPIREYGMNYQSQPLQKHEIEAMKADAKIIERVVRSYELMLDFFGMRLVDRETGLVDRAPPPLWEERYRNLVYSSHNYLRVSRILKCLSEMGLERYNAGFLLHVLNEQSEFKELDTRGIRNSMDRWWANCVRNEGERMWIGRVVGRVRGGGGVFTRDMYVDALEARKQGGELKLEGMEEEEEEPELEEQDEIMETIEERS